MYYFLYIYLYITVHTLTKLILRNRVPKVRAQTDSDLTRIAKNSASDCHLKRTLNTQ